MLCELLVEFSQAVLFLPCDVCIVSVIVTWSTRYWYDSQTVAGISQKRVYVEAKSDTLDAELASSFT